MQNSSLINPYFLYIVNSKNKMPRIWYKSYLKRLNPCFKCNLAKCRPIGTAFPHYNQFEGTRSTRYGNNTQSSRISLPPPCFPIPPTTLSSRESALQLSASLHRPPPSHHVHLPSTSHLPASLHRPTIIGLITTCSGGEDSSLPADSCLAHRFSSGSDAGSGSDGWQRE